MHQDRQQDERAHRDRHQRDDEQRQVDEARGGLAEARDAREARRKQMLQSKPQQ